MLLEKRDYKAKHCGELAKATRRDCESGTRWIFAKISDDFFMLIQMLFTYSFKNLDSLMWILTARRVRVRSRQGPDPSNNPAQSLEVECWTTSRS